jgi:anaphase-promoting complex subunit 1
MDLLALSVATVMAGTGDLVVLRRLRALHGRDDPHTTYGSHFATHLAIGAIFLGCGTTTFGTSDLAIASLLVAFYPLFPATVQDNHSHLQAFRHFWVLATEQRCLVVKDDATGQPLSVPVKIRLKPDSQSALSYSMPKCGADSFIRRNTPCLLPPLDDVVSVRTDATAQGYWNLEIDFERQPELIESFRKDQNLYIRRRPTTEGTFPATLRALGQDAFSEAAECAERDPLEWLFHLKATRPLTHAERALVLDRSGIGGSFGEVEGASTVVDTRLVLENSMDGWSRDRLLGLQLLFNWADRRALVAQGCMAASSERAKEDPDAAGAKTVVGNGKEVEMNTSRLEKGGVDMEDEVEDKESGWWMRDSVIEMLKGKAWLAGREE